MTILIRGGVVIDTDPTPFVTGHSDVLIDNDLIAAVGTALPVPEDAEVIDATGRLVLPGFVDTHRHTWQAAVRSIAPDISFADYLERVLGRLTPRYRPDDVYAGNLAGALECLDAGITTLLDWSHIQLTPAHTEATVAALRASGIRAVLGYCYGGPDGPEGLATEGRRVHRAYFDASGPLLSMAIAALGPEIAGEALAAHEWRLARDLGLPVTVHMGGHGQESAERGLAFLRENDLFGPGTTYVHPNHYTDDALKRIADSGGTASVSPLIEAELGIGYPATGRTRAAGIPTGLSADAVTSGPGDMFSLMRAAYALERARSPEFTTRDALRMATIEGAEVVGLGEVTGSLRVGKQADLILLRTDTLPMSPSCDPIGAIVLSADTSCVDTVLVGGRAVKRDGRLPHHDAAAVLCALRESSAHLTT
jgi:cytosine/adenosine deaminase-related metal-dependent hydrolase